MAGRRYLSGDRLARHAEIINRAVRRAEDSRSLLPAAVEAPNDRRDDIVRFVRAYVAANRVSPSLREIGAAVGLLSPSSVAYQVRQLAAAGALTWQPDTPRSIALIEPDPAPEASDPTALQADLAELRAQITDRDAHVEWLTDSLARANTRADHAADELAELRRDIGTFATQARAEVDQARREAFPLIGASAYPPDAQAVIDRLNEALRELTAQLQAVRSGDTTVRMGAGHRA